MSLEVKEKNLSGEPSAMPYLLFFSYSNLKWEMALSPFWRMKKTEPSEIKSLKITVSESETESESHSVVSHSLHLHGL